MSLINKISSHIFGAKQAASAIRNASGDGQRRCRFEVLEERRVLSADPVVAGVTFLEGDNGLDSTPDYFEVSFEGGGETTQLTQFTINGDQDSSGDLSDGDVFFDHDDSQPGAGEHHAFEFDAANSIGISASDIRGVSISDDGLSLSVNVDNFEAGDVLAFTIDVDEVERFRFDVIASGVEFEGSFFDATFIDQFHTFEERTVEVETTIDGGFVQSQQEGIFYDEYDDLLAEGESLAQTPLNLEANNETGQGDRTAAAVDVFDLIPKPITVSGTVFHDEDLDCVHDGTEDGISGVTIELQEFDADSNSYRTVATTQTDANGDYLFGEELGLLPGEYRLVELQPEGFLDFGAEAGSEGGVVLSDGQGENNIISDINIENGGTDSTGNNFKEVLPGSISGYVSVDTGSGKLAPTDPNFQPIQGTTLQLLDETGSVVATTQTDANGRYEFNGLFPGTYSVVELQPQGFLDGGEVLGNIDGQAVGTVGNDRFDGIEVGSGDDAVRYDFCEHEPASISGYVSVDTGSGKLAPTDPNFQPIEGVAIQLLDENGSVVATTRTDASGRYEFNELLAGTYSVVEAQPSGFLDGGEALGNIDGQQVGVVGNDRFDQIVLGSGDDAVRYDFCEHDPASISGYVSADNGNGKLSPTDPNFQPIEGTTIQLLDESGTIVATTQTDANGRYEFNNLLAGTYSVVEVQPIGFLDGGDVLGNIDGQQLGFVGNDRFDGIVLGSGDDAVRYDFCEHEPASLKGSVYHDANDNGVRDIGEEGIENVVIELMDGDGNLISRTVTDANGDYCFHDLLPGEYMIAETQPSDFIDTAESLGSLGGDVKEDGFNVTVNGGDNGVNYDFGELLPAEIHGRVFEDGPAFETEDGEVPDGFRDLRDGIFTAGVDTPIEGVTVELYFFFDPNGSLEARPVTISEVQSGFYPNIDASDPDAPVVVQTNADGEYWFQGLRPGSYVVVESQPEGFVDANDISGTTENGSDGFAINSGAAVENASTTLSSVFNDSQLLDVVANIGLESGGISIQNNFTEVRALQVAPPTLINPNPAGPTTPANPGNPVRPNPGITGFPGLAGAQTGNFISIVGAAGGSELPVQAEEGRFSWHLSVVNGGLPRAAGSETAESNSVWQQAGYIADADWTRFDMNDAVWTFTTTTGEGDIVKSLNNGMRFGAIGGTPLAGDFDGNGIDEVAIFIDGYWLIDINHNGKWDQSDLLAKLGDADDRPVVGDWDGDGKDDIGIYGPMWEHDQQAIDQEPGLPNPDNDPYTKPKNVPPEVADATNGSRLMKLTSFGRQQADVVDHVFGLDEEDKLPVTGDWNGNGVRSIGTFADGAWELDINGDGRFDHLDESVRFGRAGDVPLVGDFNGDGIEEIAIYRNGTWIIDSNGNRELDITDRSFEMGGASDKPVVGDWDGDGTDEPAIYTESSMSDFN